MTKPPALTIPERKTIIRALDDPPPGLEELRAVLVREHVGRCGTASSSVCGQRHRLAIPRRHGGGEMWSSMAGGMSSVMTVLLVAASGCGADSADSESHRCVPLSAAAADALRSVLKHGLELHDPVAVRSDDYLDPPIYMVAAVVDGEAALWAMTSLDGSADIYSANDHAYSISDVGYSDPVGGAISERDDGAAEALACV